MVSFWDKNVSPPKTFVNWFEQSELLHGIGKTRKSEKCGYSSYKHNSVHFFAQTTL
jgi:hypothetical protein